MASDTRRRRGWWASIRAGAVICIGCCLAPLLAAIGLAGGGLALLSVSWLEPLGFVLIGIGAVGLVWSRVRAAHRRAAASPGGCGRGSCGCGAVVSASDPTRLPLLPDPPR